MKFSSGERRATVLLLILTGVIIGVTFLLRSNPDPQSLPAVESPMKEVRADSVAEVKSDSAEIALRDDKIRRKKVAKSDKRQKNVERENSGYRRDFLDEPVKQ